MNRRILSITAGLLGMSIGALALAASPPEAQHEYGRAGKNRSGLKESDICLSCRFRSAGHSPEDAMRTWRPTRLEWSYIREPAFLQFVRDSGAVFVGTLNTIENDGPDQDEERLDSSRMVAPWMVNFRPGGGVGWSCVNKPVTLARQIKTLKTYADLGVHNIQYDDSRTNLSAYGWGGGCFCPECLQGFAAYLARHATADDLRQAGLTSWEGFNYREYLKTRHGWTTPEQLIQGRKTDPLDRHFRMFQLTSSRSFFDRLLAAAEQMAGQPIRLSINANLRHASDHFLLDLVDYCVGETAVGGESELWDIIHTLKLCDSLSLPQVMSPRPVGKEVQLREVRRAIATVYASGHRMLVPWDVWNFDNPRWFGTEKEYGDLFEFIRQSASLLDGYRAWSDVVLAVPLSSDRRQGDKAAAAALKLLQTFTLAGYSCRYAAYGDVGELVHVPVVANDFQGAAVIVPIEPGSVAEMDAAVLRAVVAKAGAAVLPQAQASPEALRKLRGPSMRIDPASLLVLPRIKPGDTAAPLAIHLVNLKDRIERGSLRLSSALFAEKPVVRATLCRPGQRETPLTFRQDADSLFLELGQIDVWAIVRLEQGP